MSPELQANILSIGLILVPTLTMLAYLNIRYTNKHLNPSLPFNLKLYHIFPDRIASFIRYTLFTISHTISSVVLVVVVYLWTGNGAGYFYGVGLGGHTVDLKMGPEVALSTSTVYQTATETVTQIETSVASDIAIGSSEDVVDTASGEDSTTPVVDFVLIKATEDTISSKTSSVSSMRIPDEL